MSGAHESGQPPVDSAALERALAAFRVAGSLVSKSTAALMSGGAALGGAVLHDLSTLVAKVPGRLSDHYITDAYVRSRGQLDTLAGLMEILGVRMSPPDLDTRTRFAKIAGSILGVDPQERSERAKFFGHGVGLGPLDVIAYGAAAAGGGVAGNFVKSWLSSAVQPMTETLVEFAPHIPNPEAIVGGILAIAGLQAYKVFVLRGMEDAAGFEQRRELAREAARQTEGRAQRHGHIDPIYAKQAKEALEKLNTEFSQLPTFSPEGVEQVRTMMGAGAERYDIYKGLSGRDQQLVKQIGDKLSDYYRMPSEQASKVCLELIDRHGGDIPLLTNILHSRQLPASWVAQYGFAPETVLGETRIKDRPSAVRSLLLETTTKIKDFYSERCRDDQSPVKRGPSPGH